MSRCFEEALRQAGVEIPCDMEIPALPTIKRVEEICDTLGLRWFPSGPFVLPPNGKYIALRASDGCLHAEYSPGGNVSSRVKYLIGIPQTVIQEDCRNV